MRYLPSPQVQAELIKAGLEQFCNGIDFEDADWNAQRDYFRSHPIHAKESDAEIDDRTGYFLIWRDHGVPQDKSSGDAAETVNAKRITVMHEALREMCREHFPALRQDFADVKNSTSIQANAAKMLGAQFSQYSDTVITAGVRNILAIRAVQSAVSANASETRSGLDEVKTTVRDSLTHVAKIIGWGLGAIFALLLALVVMTAFGLRAHAQIDVIQFQDSSGTLIKTFAAPFKIKCSTNLTCTPTGSTMSITASASGATAFSGITAATNSNAGSFIVSANTWDFTAATLLKLRVAAGLTSSVNGDLGYDTTNKNWHIWANAVDNFIATIPVSVAVTSGHLATWSIVSGVLTLNDGGAVPSGGTPCTGTASSVQYNNGGAFGCISTMTTDGTIVTAKVGADWLFVDPTSPTKKFSFDASNITAGQTRTVNIPDASSTTTQAIAAVAHKAITAMSAQGVFTLAQFACGDLSDAGAFCNGTAYSSLTGVPATFAPTAHNLLSASHGDTTAASAVRGDGIFAIGASPTWQHLAHSSATGGYFKWNGTDIVASTLAASGTGSPTACTNQAVTAFTLNADAAPTSTCTTITSAFTSGSFPATAHNLLSGTHGDTTTHTVARGDLIAGIGASPSWTAVAAGGTNTYPKWNASADVIASTLAAGGVGSCAASNWVHAINADAAPTCTQPAYSDISGTPTLFYQTVQNASGTGVTQEPKIEFTGSAVTSVVDDGANTRTVVTLTAGTGGTGSPGGSDTQVQFNNATAFGGITNLTSDGTNVTKLTAGAGPFDMTAATLTALRVAGGLTTSTNGDFGYDSTAKVWHAWQNGADRLQIVSTNVGNAGQAFLSNADGSGAFADPIVSGNDAVGGAPTKNPVQVSGVDGSGNIQRILTNTAGAVQDQQVGSASVFSGQLAVSATPTALPTNSARNVCVKAATTNGFSVYLGSASVTPSTGMELAPGDNLCMPVSNANLVSLVAVSTGASISFVGTN